MPPCVSRRRNPSTKMTKPRPKSQNVRNASRNRRGQTSRGGRSHVLHVAVLLFFIRQSAVLCCRWPHSAEPPCQVAQALPAKLPGRPRCCAWPYGPSERPMCRTDATWKVGLARVKITPQRPVALLGYGDRSGPFESVAADIYAKAMALEDQRGQRAVLVTADLVGFQAAVVTDEVCRRIMRADGTRAPAAALQCLAQHTGPLVSLDPHPQANSVAHPPLSRGRRARNGGLHATTAKPVGGRGL